MFIARFFWLIFTFIALSAFSQSGMDELDEQKNHELCQKLAWQFQMDINVTHAKSIGESQAIVDSIRMIFAPLIEELDTWRVDFYENRMFWPDDDYVIQGEHNRLVRKNGNLFQEVDFNDLSNYHLAHPAFNQNPIRYNDKLLYLAPTTLYFFNLTHTSPYDYKDDALVLIDFLLRN